MINKLNTELIKRAKEFLLNSGLSLSLKIEEIPGDLLGCFNILDQTVSLNLRKIIKNAQEEQLEVCDYMEVILCHELGHASDSKLTLETLEKINLTNDTIFNYLEEIEFIKEEKGDYDDIIKKLDFYVSILEDLEYPAEERAWALGWRYVPERLHSMYTNHSRSSLEAYKMNYDYFKSIKN